MDFRRAAAIAWSCVLLSALARASVPEQPPADSAASPFAVGVTHVKPVNLQVLAADTPSAELGRLMKGFERDLDAHLRFGRALGEPFVQRLKKLFPNSCKRGSRQQNQLKS